jgi:putative hemolysin
MNAEDATFWMILGALLVLGIWLNAVQSALIELSGGRIRKLDPQNKRLAERAEAWLDAQATYLLTLRLLLWFALALSGATAAHLSLAGNSFAGELLAGFGTALVFEVLGAGWLASYFWPLLQVSMPLVQLARLILWPAQRLIELARDHLLKYGEDPGDEDEPTPEDEIISLVEQAEEDSEEDNPTQTSEHRMIRNIFGLSETLVREIMTPRVDIKAVERGASVQDVVKLILDSGHSRIPVYRESVDEIIGIVYSKDLLDPQRLAGGGSAETIARSPMFVPATKDVKDLLEEFKSTQNHIAVVIDEYGGTAGLVSIEDILEEIVGDIRDEYDGKESPGDLVREADGALLVEARTPIGEVNELLNLNIPDDEDYDTIAGYISTELGRIPHPPEILVLGDLQVEILDGDERRMSRLRLRRVAADEGQTHD